MTPWEVLDPITNRTKFITKSPSLLNIVTGNPSGSLLKYNPHTKELTVLKKREFLYANGVTLAPDESYLLMCETGAYRVLRYWITGDKAGTMDVFNDQLPGYPDGITTGTNGRYWVAIFSKRSKFLDAVHPYPLLKDMLMRLPEWMHYKPPKQGIIVSLDMEGKLKEILHDGDGSHISPISAVQEYDGHLFIGTLGHSYLGVYKL